jgi:hypothetical protein
MKTINISRLVIIALLVGFISTFSSYASSPAAVSAKNIREKFVNAVMNPDDQTNVPTTGEVDVVFTVNDDGTVYIKKLKASNDDAAKYVKDKIEELTLNDFVHPYNQVYKIKFKFEQD